jgi:enterochelin esterase-like enzyme
VPTCTETQGSLQQGVINTDLLDKPMTYNVYLPPCYTFDETTRYPVLYLLHGQTADENQWLQLGLAETADRLVASGELQPFIVVMPFDYSLRLPLEYPFEEVFVQMLLPEIDSQYRTLAERPGRAIGGLSRGGGWALWIGLRHPDLFSAIGGHSPGIFNAQFNSTMIKALQAIPPELQPVIYLDAGRNDIDLKTISRFTTLLVDLNLPHEWRLNLGYHDESYWHAHLEEYLRWYDSRFQSLP